MEAFAEALTLTSLRIRLYNCELDMTEPWTVTMKPTFQTEWLGLPPKESKQILEKISLLSSDPTPDAKVKKKLKYQFTDLYRIRSGNYRLFYTFKDGHVSLLALRRRDDKTYDEDIEAEFLEVYDPDVKVKTEQPDWEKIFSPQEERTPLPAEVTPELLERLRIPQICHKRLCNIECREDIFECPGIPDEYLLKLDEYLYERPLTEVMQQPDYVAQDVSDLFKYKEGSLLGFLLKLDPEQKKFVEWALEAKGPTLVKGGPGTGKSTVALYRTKALLGALPKHPPPRILFTTYTNALVAFSQQLLEQLLGDRASAVEVRTADSLVLQTSKPRFPEYPIAKHEDLDRMLEEAIEQVEFSGNALEVKAQQQTIERLGKDYLKEEIFEVIEARGLTGLEDYLEAGRPGRRVGLNAMQRRAVWTVRKHVCSDLEAAGQCTWEQLRRHADEIVRNGQGPPPYDAVIVDETQDLNPTALSMLVGLCMAPNRLFVTADANQSIYGSGFRWGDVHNHLQFRGRTGILRTNHRSTREIGLATTSYLREGRLEEPAEETLYAHEGPQPAVRAVENQRDEADLLARFLPGAARELHLAIGSCAVLVPSEKTGRALTGLLIDRGLQVQFMPGRNLDLKKPVIKVLTLKSAKGLEFPIVAVAGFVDTSYPRMPSDLPEEAVQERLSEERRTLYVAMTRAMRGLLVVVSAKSDSPLFRGFDESYWNLG